MDSGCNFVVCAKTEEEILEEVRYHARAVHQINDIPDELYEKARFAIRDVPYCYR
jgi:predicted small metal-binding protein